MQFSGRGIAVNLWQSVRCASGDSRRGIEALFSCSRYADFAALSNCLVYLLVNPFLAVKCKGVVTRGRA